MQLLCTLIQDRTGKQFQLNNSFLTNKVKFKFKLLSLFRLNNFFNSSGS